MATKPSVQSSDISHEQSLSLIRATIESSHDGILIVTSDDKILDYNQRFASMWRIPKKILETKDEKKALEYVNEQLIDPQEFLTQIKELYQHPDAVSVDILHFKDGRVFERYSHPHKLNGNAVGRIWTFRDVTRRTKLEEKLQHHITHDGLTKLPNRLLLLDRLRNAITVASKEQSEFVIFVFDIDRFKNINDSMTHAVGDVLLKEIANRLQLAIRVGDTVARIGGDEFVVIANNLRHHEKIVALGEQLLDVFRSPFKLGDKEIGVTASAGVGCYPKDGDTVDILLRNADTAVYRAKDLGANRCEFYSPEMSHITQIYLEQESELRRALLREDFFLEYQPQFSVLTGKLVGVEALVRWRHPQKGVIVPNDFISLAEDTGLILQLGDWVIKAACKQAKAWSNAGFPFFRMAVNVGSKQLKQANFVSMIKKQIELNHLDPKMLEIEITEHVIINSVDVVNVVCALKDLGVEVTLDDFGMGFTSLSSLRKIPLNRLKIDRTFIQNIPHSGDDCELVRAIIAVSKAFHLVVLAEGVDTEAQVEFLQKEHCDEVQGFYFMQPLSVDEFENFIAKISP